MKDQENRGALKKEIFGCFFKAPLFLGKWCEVTTYSFIQNIYIYIYIYIKKKINIKYMTEIVHCH